MNSRILSQKKKRIFFQASFCELICQLLCFVVSHLNYHPSLKKKHPTLLFWRCSIQMAYRPILANKGIPIPSLEPLHCSGIPPKIPCRGAIWKPCSALDRLWGTCALVFLHRGVSVSGVGRVRIFFCAFFGHLRKQGWGEEAKKGGPRFFFETYGTYSDQILG